MNVPECLKTSLNQRKIQYKYFFTPIRNTLFDWKITGKVFWLVFSDFSEFDWISFK